MSAQDLSEEMTFVRKEQPWEDGGEQRPYSRNQLGMF